MSKKNLAKIASALLTSTLLIANASATTIVLNPTSGFTGTSGAQALAGFQEAANFWESMFSDDVTINLDIGWDALGSGILGQTGSTKFGYTAEAFQYYLNLDATSALDSRAMNNFNCNYAQGGTGNPYSSPACAINFIDREGVTAGDTGYSAIDIDGSKDNYWLNVNTASAKAMGMDLAALGLDPNAADASITFSSDFGFDFDTSDGVVGYDFVGVAIHEIGHALGFVSGVDTSDYWLAESYFGNQSYDLDQYTIGSVLDLFRYSGTSTQYDSREWRPGVESYFSVDGGLTNLGNYSTGKKWGDGQQASHWKDNQGLGIMDPTANYNAPMTVSGRDLLAFDAIGWDLSSAALSRVPEPSTLMIFSLGIIGFLSRKLYKKS